MVGTRPGGAGRAAIAERLRALLERRTADAAEASALDVFTQRLFARGAGYIEQLADEEVAALVWSAFRFYAASGPELRVRVITPTYVTEGWDAPVTVIETAMPDRPFIVDTIREALVAEGVEIRTFLHPLYAARRDPSERLESLTPPSGNTHNESFVHVAIDRETDAARLAHLAELVQARLEDVRVVTDDFSLMVARARAAAADLERSRGAGPDAAAVADLLRWLADGGFVFLGYRIYDVTGPDGALVLRPGSGLGLLRHEQRSALTRVTPAPELPARVRAWLAGPELFVAAKTKALSPVHRRAHMDDIGVKEQAADGRVIGERRFLGLFTSKAYAEEAAEIPLLRRMLEQILAAEQVVPGGHDYREIVATFNSMPKGELFASTAEDVRAEIRTIVAAKRADDVAVAVRPQVDRVSVVVVMPAARFSGEARVRITELLVDLVGGMLLDETLHVGEGQPTRLHYMFAAGAELLDEARIGAMRDAVHIVLRTWEEGLADALRERLGTLEGDRLTARWATSFPGDYRATVTVARAVDDVVALETATRQQRPEVALVVDASGIPSLRLHVPGQPIALADLLPVLEHLGLRPLAEDQVVVRPSDGSPAVVQSFAVEDRHGRPLDPEVGPRLVDAFHAVRSGWTDDDVLGRLVIDAGLDWRAVACLRTYAAWGVQAGLGTRAALLDTLAAHPAPARELFRCFAARFRPGGVDGDPRAALLASLEHVQSLREDRLLRALLEAIEATVRSNFYVARPGEDAIAVKLRSADLSYLARPRPLYEIFVHAPGVEGIHLRAGKVARGGIRASDRPEDLRTEVLGLMRTQTVKNAVIVPTGAKGGFVVRGMPDARPPLLDAYRVFIRALLALTDNLVDGRVVHPPGLLIHDEEDPYLVVAADKGTATFSDAANTLAVEHGFWLGDAFASGGSHGYDHKALGITARGVWECVRTHFREVGVDADTAPVTVVGIGDPSGDVFGNGLLRSSHLRMIAAFNHRHVVVDPDPDPARGYAERERLFRVGAGWETYDPAVLSAGGQIVLRAAKRVTLSPEVQRLTGLDQDAVSGEELVRAVLALPADLLFNGGIGTYVKASDETAAEVGDAANDGVRVDAHALRVRVVAEGGNLGLTPRARVEYALAGGHINADAVDNSAGVDMSDHEVNLKICLQPVVASGALAPEERNALLAAVADDVVLRVLDHNRRQSRLLGADQVRSRTALADFLALMAELERTAGLDRTLAALPDREALRRRRGEFLGLTRPELSSLMAHEKLHLQAELLASGLPDDPILEPYLKDYFPSRVGARYPEAVRQHRLRREIIAAEAANALVDELGITFVHRVGRDTGAPATDVVRAWAVAWAVADGAGLARRLAAASLAADVDVGCQLALERSAERLTTWILANAESGRPATDVAGTLGAAVAGLRSRLSGWVAGAEAELLGRRVSELEIAGLSAELARELVTVEWLPGLLDVVSVAGSLGVEPGVVAARYWALGERIEFAWVIERLAEAGAEDVWQRRAAQGLVEDVLDARRRLSRVDASAVPARPLEAVHELLRDLRAAPRVTLAALQVVVHELRRLAARVAG
jgi:glutamate dehydrogenase